MIRQILKENLAKALEKSGYKDIEAQALPATDPRFGDYYSPVALKLFKADSKHKPDEVAKKIVANLPKSDDVYTTKIAENFFINFTYTDKYLQSFVKKIIDSGDNFGKSNSDKGKKARVEFISANPTGPLHIGNARGGPLGDTISNVLEATGYHVLREYIDNDRGNQVFDLGKTLAAKAGMIKVDDAELTYKGDYTNILAEKVRKDIGQTKNLSEEDVIKKAGEIGTKLLLKDILNDSFDIGIKFDLVVHESDLQNKLPQVLKLLEKKKLLKIHDGATWFLLGKGFSESRDAVVVKSDGSYTYFGADIVYHKEKFESRADLIIDVFGSNTSGHVPKLQALVSSLGFDNTKLKIILYQFVRVKKGNQVIKMSKRAGNFVTAREILDEVGKDAFRFFLLMFDPSTHMDFDLDKAKKGSAENPVFFVQYAHARCNSVLKMAQKEGFSLGSISNSDTRLLIDSDETELIRYLIKLPEIVEDITDNFAVHLLTAYTIELADRFHRYYERVRILGKNPQDTMARLALITATKAVLHNSLQLMGISAPDRMDKVENESKNS